MIKLPTWNKSLKPLYAERDEKIWQMWCDGMTYKSIGAEVGLGPARVKDILRRERRRRWK